MWRQLRADGDSQNIDVRRLPGAPRTAASGSKMTCCSPRSVKVAKRGDKRHFAQHCESLPMGREYRSVERPHGLCPSVSLRVFIVREGEGL
jgi:hypothetical protein